MGLAGNWQLCFNFTTKKVLYCPTGRESTPHILFIQLNKITIGTGILPEEQKGTATLGETHRHIFCSYSITRLPSVSYLKNKTAMLRGNRLHISCSYSRTRLPPVSYLKKKRSTAMLGENWHHILFLQPNKNTTGILPEEQNCPTVPQNCQLHIFCSYSQTRLPPVAWESTPHILFIQQNKISTGNSTWRRKEVCTAMLGKNRHYIFCSYSWTKLPRCVGFDSIFSVLTAQQDYHQYPTWRTKRYCDAGRDSTPHTVFCSYSGTKLSPVSYPKNKTAALH